MGSRSSEKEGTEGPTLRHCQAGRAASVKCRSRTIREEGRAGKGGHGTKQENDRRTTVPGDEGSRNRRCEIK